MSNMIFEPFKGDFDLDKMQYISQSIHSYSWANFTKLIQSLSAEFYPW
jgi:hypothetical protein